MTCDGLDPLTLHPALHRTDIEINVVCAGHGTICALVTLFGSHGVLILHVCVDLITLQSGRFTEIGPDVGDTSMTGIPGKTNCHVAPATTTAIPTTIVNLRELTQVVALGQPHKLLSEIIISQALR